MEVEADPKVQTFKRRVRRKLHKASQPVFSSQPLTISPPPTDPPTTTTNPTPSIVDQPPPPSQPIPSVSSNPIPSTSQPEAQNPSSKSLQSFVKVESTLVDRHVDSQDCTEAIKALISHLKKLSLKPSSHFIQENVWIKANQ
ncbi:hypothetical protein Taro_036608 [Colocasia esculenta]|uniref:Uncharacterized protein n=1 Tax=Colocasia esculenta TaxID=4460 RepID=A0A843WDV3_COLES|nr:hypothetical protein [Colocasia esculenta]